MGAARFVLHSANSIGNFSLSSTVRAIGRSRLRWLCAVLAVPLLAVIPLAAQTAHFIGAVNTLGSGFSFPQGVAVDGSGNVFVGDNGHGAVKEIVAVNGRIPASPTINTLGSGFSFPAGVAVDAAGDVFVADAGSNLVKEIVAVNGSIPAAPTINTLGSGFNIPTGVAVDAAGDVFVADEIGVKEIVAVNGSIPASPTINTLGSGFGAPFGVAVDGNGNVFVADQGNNAVKEIVAVNGSIPASPIINTLGSGFGEPDGVAVDAAGDVFVADTTHNAVKEIVAVNGSIPASPTINTLGSGFHFPEAVGVDGSGSVFVADFENNAVKEIVAGDNFEKVNVGTGAAPLTLYFAFDTGGTINAPAGLTQGAPNLDFTDAGTGTCTTNGTSHSYAIGEICTVNVLFRPTRPGPRYGAVELLDSSGNLLATGNLQGTGVGPQLTLANTTSGSYLPSTESALGSGINFPKAVAVDGNGNVFVADPGDQVVREIVAVNGSIPASPTIKTLGLPFFFGPQGVAVDGSGNVFVADTFTGVKEIVAVNGSIPASPTVNTLGSGFYQPYAVAVDGSGNVFVADNYSEVKEIVAVNGSINTVGSGFNVPTGLAVDVTGNVFVADTYNDAVKEIVAVNGSIPASPTIKTVGSGFFEPSGVAVDAAGNVFVGDTANNAVKEILAVNGIIPASPTINTLGSGFGFPSGVAVDGSGNVFVADYSNSRVEELNFSAPPSLSFAPTDFGSESSDSPQTVAVSNDGNAPLTFEVPNSGNNPSVSSNFTLNSSVTCPQVSAGGSSGMLNAGASCGLPFDFIPSAIGAINGTAVLTDNNLNQSGAMQTINLSGTGNQIPQTITFTGPGAGNQMLGTMPMASATGGGSGNAVKISSLTPLVCTVPGGAASSPTTVSLVAPGTCTLAANQASNTDYSAAPQVTQSFTVTQAAQTITFNNPGPQVQGGALNLVATASSRLTVSFASKTTLVCTVPVGGTTASLIAPGQCSITASQAGNADYLAATPVTQVFTVTPDFVLTVTPSTTTASRPGNEPVVLKLMPVNGFKGPVTLNCTLPAGVASGTKCPGLPDTVTLNGTSTVSYSTGVLFPNNTKTGTYVVTFTAVDRKFNDSTTATFIIK